MKLHRRVPHGTTRLDHTWPMEKGYGGVRLTGGKLGGRDNPLCRKHYARWVPGGDTQLKVEAIADRYLRGEIDFDTAVRETEEIETPSFKQRFATKRDLLMVLSRRREAEGD